MTSPAVSRSMPFASPPWGAIAVSTFGAIVGATMPLAVILSMPDISGGLSVGADEASWIVTVYNVGVLVGLPAAVALGFMIGRGRAMQLCGLGFALASLAAGVGDSLPWITAWRFAQGFFGGALPLLMMLIVLTSLPPHKGQLEGLALFAAATTVGVGLAAWIAATLIEIGGWRALFTSQALAGAIYVALASLVLRGERGNRELVKTFDWPGFVLLSVGVGLIVVFLSEGERRFWFERWWLTASLVCGLVALAFAIHGMKGAKRPLLVLEIFRKPTFSWAIVLQIVFRFGTLVALFIAPQHLARLQAFRTEQLATVMLTIAWATLLTLPIAYWLTRKSDPRIALSVGLATIALGAAMCAQITADWAGTELIAPLALVGIGQALFSVATMRYAVYGATLHDGPSRGIVFNVARTFGLVGGLALASHTIVEREKFHSSILTEAITSLEPATAERLALSARALGPWLSDAAAAQRGALAGLAQGATKQAFTLAFQDTFVVVGIALAVAALLVWVLPALPPANAASISKPPESNQ